MVRISAYVPDDAGGAGPHKRLPADPGGPRVIITYDEKRLDPASNESLTVRDVLNDIAHLKPEEVYIRYAGYGRHTIELFTKEDQE